MKLTLSNLLQVEEAKRLESVLASKGQSPILLGLGSTENAMRFMRACVRGSYLFGKHVVPNYLSHAFFSLTRHKPADDLTGLVLRDLIEMCVGELSTNNIFNRPGECHAHFNDMFEAYQAAGGNSEEFYKFFELAETIGTEGAIEKSPELWGQNVAKFAKKELECCNEPLTSFILMACNEALTTIIYPVALEYLPKEERFAKFRHFLEVHVQLDGDEHGYVALEWLKLYLQDNKISVEEITEATKKILSLYEKE